MVTKRTRILKAAAIGFIFTLAALLIVSGVFYLFTIDEKNIPAILNLILFSSSLIVGVNSSKNAPDKGYQNGLVSGAVFSIGYAVASVFLNGFEPFSLVVKMIIILIISTFGGIIGINLKKKKR